MVTYSQEKQYLCRQNCLRKGKCYGNYFRGLNNVKISIV